MVSRSIFFFFDQSKLDGRSIHKTRRPLCPREKEPAEKAARSAYPSDYRISSKGCLYWLHLRTTTLLQLNRLKKKSYNGESSRFGVFYGVACINRRRKCWWMSHRFNSFFKKKKKELLLQPLNSGSNDKQAVAMLLVLILLSHYKHSRRAMP